MIERCRAGLSVQSTCGTALAALRVVCTRARTMSRVGVETDTIRARQALALTP
jgi:hypothetical protein